MECEYGGKLRRADGFMGIANGGMDGLPVRTGQNIPGVSIRFS